MANLRLNHWLWTALDGRNSKNKTNGTPFAKIKSLRSVKEASHSIEPEYLILTCCEEPEKYYDFDMFHVFLGLSELNCQRLRTPPEVHFHWQGSFLSEST